MRLERIAIILILALLALAAANTSTIVGDLILQNAVEEDLRFPSQGINPPGADSDPTRSDVTGLLIFAPGANRIIAGNFQMPHGWKAGTAITPHIHVLCTTASTNVSKWRFDYSISNDGGNLSAGNLGTYTEGAVQTFTNPNNIQKHTRFSFPAITMTGYTESSVVIWKLTRLDADNTDAGDIVLLDFDVHYSVEKFGKNI